MFGWFRKRKESSRAEARDIEIRNVGLDLAMEWGENWLRPIQDRLSAKYPDLDQGDLDRYDRLCRAAMKEGHDLVWDMAQVGIDRVNDDEWKRQLKASYPWIDDANLSRLFSQGMYYAWKG